MACRFESIAIGACKRYCSAMSTSTPSVTMISCAKARHPSSLFECSNNRWGNKRLGSTPSPMRIDPRRYFHYTPYKSDDPPTPVPDSPKSTPSKVEELFQKIIWLDMVEVHLLAELINEKLGVKISDAERERMAGGGRSRGASSGDEDEPKEEAKPEQTVFDLKLTGFDEKAKIKVIKEVRSITALGLKEAKELVEGVPATVKKQIKKEEAEELKAKLEAVGAQVEIL